MVNHAAQGTMAGAHSMDRSFGPVLKKHLVGAALCTNALRASRCRPCNLWLDHLQDRWQTVLLAGSSVWPPQTPSVCFVHNHALHTGFELC